MITENNFIGRSQFTTFEGVVEDRMDPLQLDRVRVRCFGYHSANRAELPTDYLPWAFCLTGDLETYTEGSWVYGFFEDGPEAQKPVVFGKFNGIPMSRGNPEDAFRDPRSNVQAAYAPGIPAVTIRPNGASAIVVSNPAGRFPRNLDEPETPRLARNDPQFPPSQNIIKEAARENGHINVLTASGNTFSQPQLPYAAQYPYNKVRETESGHAIELDDTLDHERISIYHRSGTYKEFHPNGDSVENTVGRKYSLSATDEFEHCNGRKIITIDKSLELLVNKSNSSYDLTFRVGSGGNLNITVDGGNNNITINGNVNQIISGNVVQSIGGSVTQGITGNVYSTAPHYYLTGNVTITGNLQVLGTTTTGGLATIGGSGTGTATFTTPMTLTGNSFTVSSGDVVADGKSLKTHTHTDPQGGTVGPPI